MQALPDFVYLWDFRADPRSWEEIADWCAARGLALAIKAWDGEWRWSRQWTPEIVALFKARGVRVFPWGYGNGNYSGPPPDNAAGDVHHCTIEADAANAAWAASIGGDGLIVLNMEVEWCARYQPRENATAYIRRVRALLPGHTIGASVVPSEHDWWDGYPLPEICAEADVLLPQVYCNQFGDMSPENVAWWVAEGSHRSYGKPCLPTFDLANNAGEASPPDYLGRAIDAAHGAGAIGVSYWRLGCETPAQDAAFAAGRAAATALAALIAGAVPHSDPHTALLDAYDRADRNGFRWLLGDLVAAGHADMSALRPDLTTRARWLECEKAVLWCGDDLSVDALHPGQLAQLFGLGRAVQDQELGG